MLTSFSSANAPAQDALLVGGNVISRRITLASGQNLLRGAVLGRVTSGGRYVLSASASSDGSQTPDLILAEDTNASGGDVETVAYETGNFSEPLLILGSGHSLASIREGLRVKGIHLVSALPAV